jgi:hypothetical protein
VAVQSVARGIFQLYILAILLALVLGGVQSAIRATVAAAAPEGRAGVTFGVLQVGAKASGAAREKGGSRKSAARIAIPTRRPNVHREGLSIRSLVDLA